MMHLNSNDERQIPRTFQEFYVWIKHFETESDINSVSGGLQLPRTNQAQHFETESDINSVSGDIQLPRTYQEFPAWKTFMENSWSESVVATKRHKQDVNPSGKIFKLHFVTLLVIN